MDEYFYTLRDWLWSIEVGERIDRFTRGGKRRPPRYIGPKSKTAPRVQRVDRVARSSCSLSSGARRRRKSEV